VAAGKEVIRKSFLLLLPYSKMPVEVGQFDDAVEVDSRHGRAYIDQESAPQVSYAFSDSSPSDEDDDDFSEDLGEDYFDDLRVEDEDWEISEKGAPCPCSIAVLLHPR
jgi:hypothetical protein